MNENAWGSQPHLVSALSALSMSTEAASRRLIPHSSYVTM